jgi:hypothetical protein
MTTAARTQPTAWAFRTGFRRNAFGWKGTQLAIGRINEALAEIRAVAQKHVSPIAVLAGPVWMEVTTLSAPGVHGFCVPVALEAAVFFAPSRDDQRVEQGRGDLSPLLANPRIGGAGYAEMGLMVQPPQIARTDRMHSACRS